MLRIESKPHGVRARQSVPRDSVQGSRAARQGSESILNSFGTQRKNLGSRTWSGVLGAAVIAMLGVPFAARAQMAVPRYQSPVEAPTPQLKLPTPAPVSSPSAAVVEDVIARVNDQIIDRSDVQRKEEGLQQDLQQGRITSDQEAEEQRNLLRNMIDEQLLLSRGKELDVNVDADVIRQMDDIRKQNHLDSMEALEKAVNDSGISYEDWRADLKNHLVEQNIVRDEVGRTMRRPTPQDEQAYYDAHKQEFTQPEKIRLSEILIPTAENATDAQLAAAQAKAQDVVDKLKAGTSFADLAKQVSGGQTAANGGDLGTFERGQLGKVLEDATFPLQPGQTTQPIRTRQGFVVLEVTGHTVAGAQPLKDVEQQVQEAIYEQEMQPALRKYLTSLREKAYIDIAPGFVDTGASPNETKPIFASNTLPPVKKKVTQKERLVTARESSITGEKAGKAPAETAPSAAPAQPATVKNVSAPNGKKKKVRREKIRFGQAPENPLPAGPSETLAAGQDQGPGATASVLPPTGGQEAAPIDAMTANLATPEDPLAPSNAPDKKTRFTDRAKTEKATKQAEKVAKVRAKALETPTAMTQDEAVNQQVQNSALGLNGDTAKKKKVKRQKGDPKERVQQEAPKPPAPKPVATPIPPKTVRQNGEPTADQTTLPPANATPPSAPVDTTPSTPGNPAPQPPPQ